MLPSKTLENCTFIKEQATRNIFVTYMITCDYVISKVRHIRNRFAAAKLAKLIPIQGIWRSLFEIWAWSHKQVGEIPYGTDLRPA
jgi:hypothetical protein